MKFSIDDVEKVLTCALEQGDDYRGKLSDMLGIIRRQKTQQANATEMLRGQLLIDALWWFIDNVPHDDPMRSFYYSLLRERMTPNYGKALRACMSAHDGLSEALESPGRNSKRLREAAITMTERLNALWESIK